MRHFRPSLGDRVAVQSAARGRTLRHLYVKRIGLQGLDRGGIVGFRRPPAVLGDRDLIWYMNIQVKLKNRVNITSATRVNREALRLG